MRRGQGGFSYVVVMFLVAVLSIGSLRALTYTRNKEQREKEAELLWVGEAYRNAIAKYYNESPGSVKKLPSRLEDLLYDERLANPTRPLRKLYRDPITGMKDWGVVKNDNGQVVGVYSKSQQAPLKRNGFPAAMAAFTNAQRYSDWKFVFTPVN